MSEREATVREGHCAPSAAWRGTLRRELALWLLVKAAALALLWGVFFSPAHRVPVTAAATGAHLALRSPVASPVPPPGAAGPGGTLR